MFKFNGGVDGDCIVSDLHPETALADGEIQIPCDVLMQAVADWVRDRRIAELESATTEEILGMPKKEKQT